jgi:hypothetical protein
MSTRSASLTSFGQTGSSAAWSGLCGRRNGQRYEDGGEKVHCVWRKLEVAPSASLLYFSLTWFRTSVYRLVGDIDPDVDVDSERRRIRKVSGQLIYPILFIHLGALCRCLFKRH